MAARGWEERSLASLSAPQGLRGLWEASGGIVGMVLIVGGEFIGLATGIVFMLVFMLVFILVFIVAFIPFTMPFATPLTPFAIPFTTPLFTPTPAIGAVDFMRQRMPATVRSMSVMPVFSSAGASGLGAVGKRLDGGMYLGGMRPVSGGAALGCMETTGVERTGCGTMLYGTCGTRCMRCWTAGFLADLSFSM